MFIVFGGLPGTGKSAIARGLSERLGAVYLRIDTIEQALRSSHVLAAGADIGPAGYVIACRLAADNLRMGRTVIADSVNPIALTRSAYREVAEREAVSLLEVEVVCSDKEEHRRRVETRISDVGGLVLPTWEQIVARHYEEWDRHRIALDTARLSVAESVETIIRAMPSATMGGC